MRENRDNAAAQAEERRLRAPLKVLEEETERMREAYEGSLRPRPGETPEETVDRAVAYARENPRFDDDAYDLSDPKHPDHHDVYADVADMRED